MNPRHGVNAPVRHWTKVAAAVALAAAFPTQLRAMLACIASIMLEALPLLVLANVAARITGSRARWIAAYLGCGCGGSGSARSLPAAVLVMAAFGPLPAIARVFAGALFARPHDRHDDDPAGELVRLVPAAAAGALVAVCVPHVWFAALPPVLAFSLGAAAGAIASPCALGGVALAASLKSAAPFAACGVLCTAGIVDLRRFVPRMPHVSGDATTYALLALCCAVAAATHGAMLVHPRWTLALALAALGCLWYARRALSRTGPAVAFSALMLVVVTIGAPAPPITTTATTLAGAYAGERLSFIGAAHGTSLARYGITCCRADAEPIVLAIDRSVRDGAWYRASGTLEVRGGGLELAVDALAPVAPPADPFIYL